MAEKIFPNQEEIQKTKNKVSVLHMFKEYYPEIFQKTVKTYSDYIMVCCPFHDDNTPSMRISLDTNTYRCYSCGENGDTISLIRKRFNLSYKHAVLRLFVEAGEKSENESFSQELERMEKTIQEPIFKKQGVIDNFVSFKIKNAEVKNQILREIFEIAKEFLNKNLSLTEENSKAEDEERNKAIKYLQSRNVPQEVIKEIGYFPLLENVETSVEFTQSVHNLGFNLTQPSIFSRRILFPLYNQEGGFAGFTARAIEKEAEEQAKYVTIKTSLSIAHKKSINSISVYTPNSWDTLIGTLKEKRAIILCEGPFDAIGFSVADIKNCISVLGVNADITNIIIKIMQSAQIPLEKIILAYDNDEAGKNALKVNKDRLITTLKSIGLENKFQIYTVHPTTTKDFADFFLRERRNKEDFRQIFEEQKKEFFINK